MSKSRYKIENGLFILHTAQKQDQQRDEQRFRLDKKENRLYDDGEVREFPKTFSYNLHKPQWKIREGLIEKFDTYLNKILVPETEPKNVLVIACGNGWLPARIAGRDHLNVIAIDDRQWLLEQAVRVFYQSNLKFMLADINRKAFPDPTFDLIVIQEGTYLFPNLDTLLDSCLACLNPEGEIHLLSNLIFPDKKFVAAQAEMEVHFAEIDCPHVSEYVHLHNADSLEAYSYTLMTKVPGFSLRRKKALESQKKYEWVKITQ